MKARHRRPGARVSIEDAVIYWTAAAFLVVSCTYGLTHLLH